MAKPIGRFWSSTLPPQPTTGMGRTSLTNVCIYNITSILLYVTVYDVEDEEVEIGTLSISVECLNTLQAIKEELPQNV